MILLINTITAWYEPPRARHQLSFALAKNHRIVFIARNEIGIRKLKIERIDENITVITPYFPLGYKFRYRLPLINEIYQKWLFSKIKNITGDVVVVNFDFTAHILNTFFKRVIYYCNDEYIGNSRYPNWFTNQYHSFCENQVIKRALFNVTTSEYLTSKLKLINSNTYKIMLGANEAKLPEEYNGFSKKTSQQIKLGLMGVINSKQISVELINQLIEDSTLELTIIGPVEKEFYKVIKNKDRISFTGELTGERLLNELMNIDIGLALYNIDKINPGATPNKLWQYLSVGKPVVISQLPNLDPSIFPPNSIYVYKHRRDIIKLIHLAYSDNSENLSLARIRFSKQNSWDSRAEEFIQLLNHYLLTSH